MADCVFFAQGLSKAAGSSWAGDHLNTCWACFIFLKIIIPIIPGQQGNSAWRNCQRVSYKHGNVCASETYHSFVVFCVDSVWVLCVLGGCAPLQLLKLQLSILRRLHLRKCQMHQYTAVLPAFHLPGAKIAYETAGKGQGRLGETRQLTTIAYSLYTRAHSSYWCQMSAQAQELDNDSERNLLRSTVSPSAPEQFLFWSQAQIEDPEVVRLCAMAIF